MSVTNPSLVTNFGAGGQIVRIFLENFMSSDTVEVIPGLHLNLIIGPNGSGKSTLLSAVLLGLGGKLSTLNRHNMVDFVKVGCNQCQIELELRNPDGPNHVIKRVITNTNKTQFFLNDKSVSKSEIDALRTKYNIQVDNLCCFLSQEKVQDFAKMDRHELLENTEMTIGEGELLAAHNALKQHRVILLECQGLIKKNEDDLDKETNKNERLRGKVQAIKEKNSLCDKVMLLNQKKHWMLYKNTLEERKGIEKDLKVAEVNADKKEQELKAEEMKYAQIEGNSRVQKEACELAKRAELGKKSVMEDRISRLQRRIESHAELERKLQNKISEEDDKKAAMFQYRANVEKLTNDLNAISSTQESEVKKEEQRIAAEYQKCRDNEAKVSQQITATDEEIWNKKNEVRLVEREKEMMGGVRAKRIQFLRNKHQHVIEAMQWIKDHENLFKGKVFNPMLLELNVTDRKVAAQVEATIPFNDLIAFVCNDREDVGFLMQKLRKEKGLKINALCSEDALNCSYNPPEPIRNLRPLGFYGYLIDFIEGPPELIQTSCSLHGIHRIPVGDGRVNGNTTKVPNHINRFFSDDSGFIVSQSRYQNRATSTRVNRLATPQFFNESIDPAKMAELENRLQMLHNVSQQKNQLLAQLSEEKNRIRARMGELRRKQSELATHAEERKSVEARLERAKQDLAMCQKSINDPQQLRNEFLQEKASLNAGLARTIEDLEKANAAMEKAHIEYLKASLLLKSSRIGIEAIQANIQECKEAAMKAKETYRLVETKYKVADQNCKRASQDAKELTEGIGPNNKEFKKFELLFRDLADSIDELDQAIDDAQARADFLDVGSAEMLADFNKRERDIEILKETIEDLKHQEQQQLAIIAEKREAWIAPVKDIIAKVDKTFSRHFETMKCAGGVTLCEPENENDFAGYGVSIQVKFRDEMPLQELTAYMQSGGERTVATAIYGLSLQNLTSVPFRFVDEINQGMDERNENHICNILSCASSDPNSPQYFYLTPKLMDTFDCPDNMAVLCVYNGPHAIPTEEWDVPAFIRRRARSARKVS